MWHAQPPYGEAALFVYDLGPAVTEARAIDIEQEKVKLLSHLKHSEAMWMQSRFDIANEGTFASQAAGKGLILQNNPNASKYTDNVW